MSLPPFAHGGLRGSEDPRQSRSFEGRFGRLFRSISPAAFLPEGVRPVAGKLRQRGIASPEEESVLKDLAEEMMRQPNSEPNPGIPAGYTYLGQFIGHDITFDPVSSLQGTNDPEGLVDFRTPRLDLDCLYGRGPRDQPYLYKGDGVRMLLGEGLGVIADDGKLPQRDRDVPRTSRVEVPRTPPEPEPRLAIIGDPRNDENVIIAQLHAIFLRFHNRVAKEMKATTPQDFLQVQQYVRWYYQWIVLYDFLPRLVDKVTYGKVLPHVDVASEAFRGISRPERWEAQPPNLRFYKPQQDAYIPIEFSAAAYRFGHSMVRPKYRLNMSAEKGVSGGDEGFAILGITGEGANQRPDRATSLVGFDRFNRSWAIDWRLFFEFPGNDEPPPDFIESAKPDRPQFASRIDTSLAAPLKNLPFEPAGEVRSLAERNLLRGLSMQLPSGQAVAQAIGVDISSDTRDQLATKLNGISPVFKDNAPLWYYVLTEADTEGKGVQLGPVGGRIVMETFVGMMMEDGHSILRQGPKWQPTDFLNRGKFGITELISAARCDRDD